MHLPGDVVCICIMHFTASPRSLRAGGVRMHMFVPMFIMTRMYQSDFSSSFASPGGPLLRTRDVLPSWSRVARCLSAAEGELV